ncbi:MAG: acetyl-CoA carboxylase biotin carboxylase subunit [Deltaproteobacteria bacterium]|nr:acetyl-CoA carboxylase biotin carboxylase subunit [Deltaproteobacteria bacterium]
MVFRRILVANRGEIAVRVIRTCHELGLESVAVYSEVDREALHTLHATHAVEVGPAPSRESYLNIPRIIEAARRTGADAIHPGYGFLSERAAFARACQEAGIVFIGPSPEAIEVMGDKMRARAKMIEAGVPVVPGSQDPVTSTATARDTARGLGYPVMLKASAGGGGRGMRLVRSEGDIDASFEAASREALAAFGDGSVYLERFIERPRHIEVQVFGDTHGRIIHLNERECSIQRRNQKVIEEAPSGFLDADLRAKMGEIAVRAARAVNYVGAGTVEFLVDEAKNFYFLEMNTRLQVEHPVTELTTGYDLVEAQIRVAQGGHLNMETRTPRGHALEARIYAENPSKGFQPSPGKIVALELPSGPGVRVDAGVHQGYVVPSHYDAMLAKIIAYADDRETATRRLDRALSECQVFGVDTNITYLRQILSHPDFAAGRTDTGFIERNMVSLDETSSKAQRLALIAACIQHFESVRQPVPTPARAESRSVERSSWQAFAHPGRRWGGCEQ